MKQYNEKSEFDTLFKRYKTMPVNESDKKEVLRRVLKSSEKDNKTNQINNLFKPALSNVVGLLIFIIGGYFLFNEIILEDKHKQGTLYIGEEVNYEFLENDLSEMMGSTVYVPRHDAYPIGLVWVPHNFGVEEGERYQDNPLGITVVYVLEEKNGVLRDDKEAALLKEWGEVPYGYYVSDQDRIITVNIFQNAILPGEKMDIAGQSVYFEPIDKEDYEGAFLSFRMEELVYIIEYKFLDGNDKQDAIKFVNSFIQQIKR